MDNKTSKASFGTMFAVAAVWFGSHVGGGFATGNQSVYAGISYRIVGLVLL